MDKEDYNTEKLFMVRLKEIAVKGPNTIVVQVQFLSIGQERNENINSFVSRLRGAAVGCKFKKVCTCGAMVSYAENMIHDQMIHGLVEPIIQEKALSYVEDRDSLKKSMAYINILEKAKHDTLTLAGPGGLNRQGAWSARVEGKGVDKVNG